MKNILVTGGTGFVGSHTVVELYEAGYQPIILDNFSNSNKSVLAGINKIVGKKPVFYEGDFQDKNLLANIYKEIKFDGVIHFAAFKAVGESVEQPLKYYKNNVVGLVDMLEFLIEYKVPDLVFSSSCTVYGEPDALPVNESEPIKPAESPYGATKQMCEEIIKDTTKSSNLLKSISLRYFNPIGAHPSALLGELPIDIPANLVPFITQSAAGLRKELTVFGDDYPTGDGSCIRDYIHVVDLARAHIKALDHLTKQPVSYYDVFNLGSGHGNSVLELINLFEKVTNAKVPYKIGPRREGDVIATYADASRANKELGWNCKLTIEDSLKDAWRWQQKLIDNT